MHLTRSAAAVLDEKLWARLDERAPRNPVRLALPRPPFPSHARSDKPSCQSPPARSGAIWAPLARCRHRADRPWHGKQSELGIRNGGPFCVEGGSPICSACHMGIVRVRYIVPLSLCIDSSNINNSRNFTTKSLIHIKYNTIICKSGQHEPATR
jgi:hypothetical protein